MQDVGLISLLKSLNFKGYITFDLLIPNGTSLNKRFFQCYFNGQYFKKATFTNKK